MLNIAKIKKALSNTDAKLIILFSIFLPLFFLNLGSYTLENYDEAWYAEIARNILSTKNPLLLEFNEKPFFDHPPTGYVLMAISILILGANEIAVRFPSALSGFLSIIFLYLIGKNLFSRRVGIAAALILLSCAWFILRSRSGNLDSIMVFLYTLTFYLTIKLKNSTNYIYPFSAAFALLTLTKSLIGLHILLPVIAYILINKIKPSPKKIFLSLGIFAAIVAPWFFANLYTHGDLFIKKLIKIGLRPEGKQEVNYWELLRSQTFTYLHFGIRKWYYPALLGAFLSTVLVAINRFTRPKFSFQSKNIIPLLVWFFVLVWAFLNNSKTEIWHLIPLYIPLSLLIAKTTIFFADTTINLLRKLFRLKKFPAILYMTPLIPIAALSFFQIYNFRNDVKLKGESVGGLAQTAKAARNTQEDLFEDSELPVPAVAAFYSQKKVNLIKDNPQNLNTLKNQMAYGPTPFLLLTEKWHLDLDAVDPQTYSIISQDQGHVLIKVQKNLSDQPATP